MRIRLPNGHWWSDTSSSSDDSSSLLTHHGLSPPTLTVSQLVACAWTLDLYQEQQHRLALRHSLSLSSSSSSSSSSSLSSPSSSSSSLSLTDGGYPPLVLSELPRLPELEASTREYVYVVFGGVVLEDLDRRVEEYGIRPDSSLFVVQSLVPLKTTSSSSISSAALSPSLVESPSMETAQGSDICTERTRETAVSTDRLESETTNSSRVPSIHEMKPNACFTEGGVKVKIIGENFSSEDEVVCRFGRIVVLPKKVFENEVEVIAPAHPPGPVSVWISNDAGKHFSPSDSIFTYFDRTRVEDLIAVRAESGGRKATVSTSEDERRVLASSTASSGNPSLPLVR